MKASTLRDRPGEEEATPGRMSPGPRRHLWGALVRWCVSLSLLGILIAWVDFSKILAVLAKVRIAWLGALFGLFLVERVAAAFRWHILLRELEDRIGFGTTFKATLLSGFLGALLPGAVGSEVVRIAAIGRARSNWVSATVSVLVDRATGLLTLVMMVLVGGLLTTVSPPPGLLGAALAMVAALGFGGLVVACPPTAHRLGRLMEWLPGLHGHAPRAIAAVRGLVTRRALVARILILAFLFQLLRVGIGPVAAASLGIPVPLGAFFLYMPVILFLMMLPISLSGLGVREAGFVYFFAMQGGYVTPEAALSISLLIGVMTLVTQISGAVVGFTGIQKMHEGALEETGRHSE